jgi:RHS repeat-associated protein
MEITDIYQNTVKTYDYDAYGNILDESGSLAHNAFTYTGREYHPRSGLYYYRARWYNPEIGRFITQDPIGYRGGINFYQYVAGNPINYIDPSGLRIFVKGNMAKYNYALVYLNRDPGMAKIISNLTKSPTIYTVIMNNIQDNSYTQDNRCTPSKNEIHWDPNHAHRFPTGGTQSPALILGHEMAHAEGALKNGTEWDPTYWNLEEKRVITGPEADAAETLGEDRRYSNDVGEYYWVPNPTRR